MAYYRVTWSFSAGAGQAEGYVDAMDLEHAVTIYRQSAKMNVLDVKVFDCQTDGKQCWSEREHEPVAVERVLRLDPTTDDLDPRQRKHRQRERENFIIRLGSRLEDERYKERQRFVVLGLSGDLATVGWSSLGFTMPALFVKSPITCLDAGIIKTKPKRGIQLFDRIRRTKELIHSLKCTFDEVNPSLAVVRIPSSRLSPKNRSQFECFEKVLRRVTANRNLNLVYKTQRQIKSEITGKARVNARDLFTEVRKIGDATKALGGLRTKKELSHASWAIGAAASFIKGV
jgi:Holliday junction resolvasome RuvABC endonuclease subunit